ncbi:MAG: NAD(P)-binding domain-containing protein [Planctomycetes bacterium]|nr:NAD(P)-binding domain-containing protein [Planctomycetota bacterium]
MKVLIADKFQSWGVDELRGAGCEVVHELSLDGDALVEAIRKTECVVLVVRGKKVTEAMLSASNALSVVVRAGAGYNTIDVAAASKRSILVANCPGKNAVAVAELTFALILALDRRLVDNTVDLREGRWNKQEYEKARGLKGRTLGIIGLGQIGRAVAERALAFEMHVVAWSRSLTDAEAKRAGIMRTESAQDVASRCDVLTVHLPASPDTKGIINAQVLGALRDGSYVINTARAEVMDYAALADAITKRGIRAGLDVYPAEPSKSHDEFHSAIVRGGGVVYGTHHIGASTEQAQDAIAAETVRIVKEYLQSGRVENCVNLSAGSRGRFVVVVRHRNQPGVLAHTLNEISYAGVNVEEMENVICSGSEAACAQIKVASPIPNDVIRRIAEGNPHILGISSFAVPQDAS